MEGNVDYQKELEDIYDIQVEKLVLYSGVKDKSDGSDWYKFFNYTAGEMMRKLNDKCLYLRANHKEIGDNNLRYVCSKLIENFYNIHF